MNKELTELVFILDKSGSMHGLESDTIGGFNSMIDKQKGQDGKAFVTTVLFSTELRTIHDRLDLDDVSHLTEKEYSVGGCTALIDAIGETVNHISNIHKYAREEDRPTATLFVIITDGMENASRKFSSSEVKELIEKKKKDGWQFIFLGANIDAVETGKSFGIDRDMAVDYCCDSAGTALNFDCISKAVTNVRKEKKVRPNWSAEICADYASRHN